METAITKARRRGRILVVEDDRYKHIPVLLLSALPEEEQKSERYWNGPPAADDFLTKPVKPQELLERMDRLLASKVRKSPTRTSR